MTNFYSSLFIQTSSFIKYSDHRLAMVASFLQQIVASNKPKNASAMD